jgi:hypothetical protein
VYVLLIWPHAEPANDLQSLYEMVEDSGDLSIELMDLAAFATGAFFA